MSLLNCGVPEPPGRGVGLGAGLRELHRLQPIPAGPDLSRFYSIFLERDYN